MKKILIIQNQIPHYRRPFYNALSEFFDITILHSGNKTGIGGIDLFKEIIVPFWKVKNFVIQNSVISKVRGGDFDVIIAMCDLYWVKNFLLLFFLKKPTKIIYWGSWFTNKKVIDFLKVKLAECADANIFYTSHHLNEFKLRMNIKHYESLFFANNTFDVGLRFKSFTCEEKNSILFVGSFDERKGLIQLIISFKSILGQIPDNVKLILIGNGELFKQVLYFVKINNLSSRVLLEGSKNEPDELRSYYEKALASVSFGQAGLAVLQSFAFGVPFITKINAISGGEKYNIIHGFNGYFCDDSIESLSSYLKTLCNDLILAKRLGENSFNYYSDNCTLDNMVKGFVDAIDYVLKKS
jgi:glycosyltransferase involved in cell wall biosynthesis